MLLFTSTAERETLRKSELWGPSHANQAAWNRWARRNRPWCRQNVLEARFFSIVGNTAKTLKILYGTWIVWERMCLLTSPKLSQTISHNGLQSGTYICASIGEGVQLPCFVPASQSEQGEERSQVGSSDNHSDRDTAYHWAGLVEPTMKLWNFPFTTFWTIFVQDSKQCLRTMRNQICQDIILQTIIA